MFDIFAGDSCKKEPTQETVRHPPLVDFSKALDKFKLPFTKPEGKSYLHNNEYHTDVPICDPEQATCTITVKSNKEKHKLQVQDSWDGIKLYKFLSFSLNVPFEKLKIIHKGKVLSSENISGTVKQGSVYQIIGEVCQSEDNIDQRDISVMMKQTGLDRKAVVMALKRKGDLLDALLDQ